MAWAGVVVGLTGMVMPPEEAEGAIRLQVSLVGQDMEPAVHVLGLGVRRREHQICRESLSVVVEVTEEQRRMRARGIMEALEALEGE